MDIYAVLNVLLPIVLIAIGIALVVFIVELIKMVKVTRTTITDVKVHLDPTMANIEEITESIKPAVAKSDPLVDRVMLTLDAVNLEMMRVDEILEDISQITDSASSATAAVDNIASAPVKAVSNVATRVRTKLGGKNASDESAQLSAQRDDAAQALEDFRAAEAEEAQDAQAAQADAYVEIAGAAEPAEPVVEPAAEPAAEADAEADAEPAAVKEAPSDDDQMDKQPTGPIPVDEILARLDEESADQGSEKED